MTLIILIALYFVPTAIAAVRQHRNDLAIAMLNLFLGWTLLGWVIALVWSCTHNVRERAPTLRGKVAR